MRKFGHLLSAMIYQNISVIIAVGIIQKLFGIYGYFYNDRILLLVNPIYETLLPILLAFTGGRLLGGQRGAVVASFVVYGLTLASSVPIIIGAMLIGPLTGYIVSRVERLVKDKIPIGYELLITNTITGVIGVFLTILCFLYVGQSLSIGIKLINNVMQTIIYSGWLPLVAVIIEPAKVFFFNNFLNYGVLSPLGIQQAKELGKSIFFLLESNPGPGLGVLFAYLFKTIREKRKSIKLSIIVHFFGGIHEIYFPYVLKNGRLFIAVIAGGISGNLVFQWFNVGLVAVPSPGSIFVIGGMSTRADTLFVILGVFVSAIVSFLLSYFILNKSSANHVEESYEVQIATINKLQNIDHFSKVESAIEGEKVNENQHTHEAIFHKSINNILFVCEAGMGSSAVGAAMLRKKLNAANLSIEVQNTSLQDIDPNVDIIICHQTFLKKVEIVVPNKIYFPLQTFTNFHEYDELVEKIKRIVV